MAVVIETTLGDITVDLYLEQRPVTCLNFLKLCKMKYYNFNLFHTIRSGFIAQTGDPSGEGSGGQSIFALLEGPGKRFFSGEKMPKIRHTDTGLLSMVGTGDVMIGSQFFFTLGPDLDSLDGYHCVIGEVTEGHDVLRKLNDVICDETHRPYQDVRITHTVVLEDPFNDPTGLWAPTRSPSPSAERLKGGRIAPDEELDEAQGKTAEEVQEMIEEKEAKARATILEIVGDIPDADIAPPENVLFVCKLNPVTTDDDLEIIFSRFGKINSCEVIRDKKTGDSLQYAFIEFDNKKSCEDAYFKMDNVLIDDRRIHVDFSQSVSKIKWLGKGRGVKHINDDESNGPQDISKDKMKRPRSKDRSEERNNRNHEKDHHEKDRDRERSNNRRTYSRDRRERGHSRDRKSRDERVSKHHNRRERSKSNSRRHRDEKDIRNRKGHKDRSRSRSKDVRSKDKTSKHDSNHSNHDESQRSERRCDDSRKKYEENKDKDDHSRTRKSKSEKSPTRRERSVPKKSPSKDHNKEKPDKKSEKQETYQNSRNNSMRHEAKYKSEKEQENNNRSVESRKLKRKNSTAEEREINKKNCKHESKNPEPRTPSPTEKIKTVEKSPSKEDHKDKKTKKMTNTVVKKKRKPSTSSDSDSSESSSTSSTASSSSTDSDRKKKRARRKKRQSSSSSSSTSDSSSTASSSSDSSTSSSESEPNKKKRKINKKKGDKKDKKKS